MTSPAASNTIPTLGSFVSGAWLNHGATVLSDINPSRPAEIVAEVSIADRALAEAAIASAADAFRPWRATPAPERGRLLHSIGDLLERRKDEIGNDLAREEGKTRAEAIAEVRRAAAIFRYYAGQTLEPDGETYPSHSPEFFLYARRQPIGVVTVITPWNFPLAIPAWKIAPALAYGNTVVWKPAELVPLTSVHLVNALGDAGLPPGALNLVVGRGAEIGEVLVTAADVAGISFTGSNVVGQAIATHAAAQSKKTQLELGGKNPAVVLESADLDHAAEQVARGAFLSAGQKCTATSRVIVQAPVVDEFVQHLSRRARDWKVGDALEDTTIVGPLASEAQLASVERYLEVAQSDGDVIAGGSRIESDSGGYFVEPTIVTRLSPSSPVAQEEVFGPIVSILPAQSVEDAVSLANDTPFGLAASVFTRDLSEALRFADQVEAGIVKVNQETAGLEFHVPFGGVKSSSSGSREQGKAAREFYTEWKTVYVGYGG